MSARSVCSGTRPSRYHSVRAISMPFRRPALMILMPCAPRRMAFCIARFIARRNMMRFSSCCAIESAMSCASSSGLRISSMLTCTGTPIMRCSCPRSDLDVLALLADDHARARAVNRDARVLGRTLDHDLAHRGVRELLLQVVADLDVLVQHGREVLAVGVPLRASSCAVTERRKPIGWIFCPMSYSFTVADRRRRCGRSAS